MTDAIKVTIPHARPYHGVVRLVVGGLAARLDLSYEALEDLQLALESLLANDGYAAADEVTVEVGVAADLVQLAVGPLDGARLRTDLADDAGASGGVTLRRLLETVATGVALEDRAGSHWIRLEKPVPRGVVASG